MSLKRITTCIALCLMGISSWAQNEQERGFRMGVHGMGNLNKVTMNTPNGVFYEAPPGLYGPFDGKKPMRASYGAGILAAFHFNDRWYLPANFEWNNRRTSLETNGYLTIYEYSTQTMNWMASYYESEYIDYQFNQWNISAGVGLNLTKHIAIEFAPYFQKAISDQRVRFHESRPWEKATFFKQNYDYGLSTKISANLNDFYVFGGFQFGLRTPNNYTFFLQNYQILADMKVRSMLFTFGIGHTIFKSKGMR